MRALIAAAFAILATGAASADQAGYHNCSLRNLGACENSNQLFWSPTQKSGRAAAKPEFQDAVIAFLSGAPDLYLGKTGFHPARIAPNALDGPGDRHDHLANGGWFFDGFTPHDATERAAVLFSADGKIRLVALLNVEADAAGPNPTAQDLSRYRLRLYAHDRELDAASITLLQDWSRKIVGNKSLYSGVFPNNSLVETQLLVREKNHWTRRIL